VLLLFDCLIPFGCYFNIDVPSALQTDIQGVDVSTTKVVEHMQYIVSNIEMFYGILLKLRFIVSFIDI